MKTIRLESRAIEALAGHQDETLRLIEDRFDVSVSARGDEVTVQADDPEGAPREERVADLIRQIAALQAKGVVLGRDDFKTAVGIMARSAEAKLAEHFLDSRLRPSPRKTVVAKSENQRRYIDAIRENDLVFGIGPAGTGKTYLAVAMAITLLNEKRIQRILLCRPAVEAGEKLGFLPGDIAAKVDPYLRPLYDALYDMLELDRIERLLERGTIEVAPLAFMRGRTLNDSFIILDEAQNTTTEQMKMFLTRIGLDSKAVVTGDVTQIDLPAQKTSGLVEASEIVAGIPGIAVVGFDKVDVVRHPLVQRIIHAYDELAERRRSRDARLAEPPAPAAQEPERP
ncbi:MAG TPA: PhoH family protein [Candidatus Sulfotelmatobacter sp.]|jgi:phosphate starvation-inducible PhoH-like protein|nr:PhoH family protein [Candidatus Sulfotelmatobacter sp.]